MPIWLLEGKGHYHLSKWPKDETYFTTLIVSFFCFVFVVHSSRKCEWVLNYFSFFHSFSITGQISKKLLEMFYNIFIYFMLIILFSSNEKN